LEQQKNGKNEMAASAWEVSIQSVFNRKARCDEFVVFENVDGITKKIDVKYKFWFYFYH
jgi:hypothetical protein